MGVKKVNDSSLSLVADEIRAKGGTSEELTFPQGFVQGIRNLPEPGTVDTEMSDTSENAVQNKVIKAYVDSEVAGIETTTLETQVATDPSQPIKALFEDGTSKVEFGKAGDVYEMHIRNGDLQNTAFLTTQKYVDDGLGTKANSDDVYDKTETDTLFDSKQDALVADGTYYVDAEVGGVVIKLATKAYVDSKDPFMLMDFNQAISLSIPYCTENIANTSIPNIDVIISEELGAEWAIASLAKYEVTNASNQRVNCWPVCSFSMNSQKTLRLRMMCAGTSRQAVTKIAGAILLKRR